jgi:uncharacterized protein with PIN domain
VSEYLEARSLDASARCPACGAALRQTETPAVGECISARCGRRVPLEVLA